ncbi:MAG: hypothetical protein J5960_02485, partial [Desulfovibrio sp.]|nr:hypothetical protein [Desulfovibrio sp.]
TMPRGFSFEVTNYQLYHASTMSMSSKPWARISNLVMSSIMHCAVAQFVRIVCLDIEIILIPEDKCKRPTNGAAFHRSAGCSRPALRHVRHTALPATGPVQGLFFSADVSA